MADQAPQRRVDGPNSPFAIVDPAMAHALMTGRKRHLRILAQSPLAHARPGDRIAVREACIAGRYVEGKVYSTALARAEFVIFPDGWRQHRDGGIVRGRRPTDPDHLWVPAIQMPDWASRVTLVVDCVRAERLQQITRRDIRLEGAIPLFGGLLWRWPRPMPGVHLTARRAFAHHWNITHPMPGARWEHDPLVTVLGVRTDMPAR